LPLILARSSLKLTAKLICSLLFGILRLKKSEIASGFPPCKREKGASRGDKRRLLLAVTDKEKMIGMFSSFFRHF